MKNKNIKFYLNLFLLFIYIKIWKNNLCRNINKKIYNSITTEGLKNNECIIDFKNDLLNIEKNKTLIKIRGKKFIDKCLNNQNKTTLIHFDVHPIISSIIPVFNSEKTIASSICSIQNQDFSGFEIILIDDFSTDNSYQIILDLQKLDSRIKIIKNKKNMGSLYSRSIGALMSNGEYIFGLDNDDMFFSHDIFNSILKFAKNYDFDIVGFRAFQITNYSYNHDKIIDLYNYNRYPEKIIVYQPQLSIWLITINGRFYKHDMTIWAKCIKSKIYKEAIIKLEMKRYSIFVSWEEDTIANYIIFSSAKSFIFIHKYGIIHLNNRSTASYVISRDIKLFGEIFFIDILYDFTKNNTDKNYAVFGAYNAKGNFNITQFVNNTNLKYLKSILFKIIKSQYISNYYKNKILSDFKSFFI